MTVLGVIPARLGSARLPRKPLQPLRGRPLVVRVWERVRGLGLFDGSVVATDAEEVAEAVRGGGGLAILTAPSHRSGTERVAEVARMPEFARHAVVVNVQGDEPFISALAVGGAIDRVRGGDEIGTAAAPLDPGFASQPSRVKVVFDERGRALYFSRAAIPWRYHPGPGARDGRYWQHVGVYAFGGAALARWVSLPEHELERTECLEQLRPLAHGMSIGVARLEEAVPPGIDTLEDLRQAERDWDAYSTGDR